MSHIINIILYVGLVISAIILTLLLIGCIYDLKKREFGGIAKVICVAFFLLLILLRLWVYGKSWFNW